METRLQRALDETALLDHHAHAVLREHPRTLDEFRGLFSESADPRQWPHVATAISYRRGIAELGERLGCAATEDAVFERRLSVSAADYASELLRASGSAAIYLDDGFPPADEAFSAAEMSSLAACPTRPVLRIERVAEEALAQTRRLDDLREHVRAAVAAARAGGCVGLKTIAAYRTGLDIREPRAADVSEALATSGAKLEAKPLLDRLLLDALEINARDPLPVQVHAGFGDGDLLLPAANPALLKHVIERFGETAFVLLHSYPFVRDAGWLAHVYPNVFLDLSLTIPHVSRPEEQLREALELAPVSKLLYASDAALAPELYYLAATRWRWALAAVLPALSDDPEADARAILAENARALYGEDPPRWSP